MIYLFGKECLQRKVNFRFGTVFHFNVFHSCLHLDRTGAHYLSVGRKSFLPVHIPLI